jgi:hypothetical protein
MTDPDRSQDLPLPLRRLVEDDRRRATVAGPELDALMVSVREAMRPAEGDAGGWPTGGVAGRTRVRRLAALSIAFGLGVLVGVAVDPWRRSETRVVTVTREVERVVERVVTVDAGVSVVVVVHDAGTVVAANVPVDAAQGRRWLERAAQAVRDGDGEEGARWLATHARWFPRGPEADRREALEVDVALLQRRPADVQRRGRAFLTRFPHSVYRARVEAALREVDARDGGRP